MHHVYRRAAAISRNFRYVSFLLPRHMTMASKSRTYNDAIDALNSLQTPYAIIEARRKAGIRPDETSILEMRDYLRRIGYSPSDLDRLNILHVAGTKGKGSTCAFAASILGQYRDGSRGLPRRVGLFTSPHLIAVRERIRIDSAPLSEALFARYFFEVWDRLEAAPVSDGLAAAASRGGDEWLRATPEKPIYARFLTLMSYHVFLSEGVDAAVYETGIGGEFDATNVVERPVAAGISTLGIDHVFVLGATVDKIAWHKGGILKRGCPGFTVEQVPEAMEVLEARAREKGVELRVVGVDSRLEGVKVRPDALFQKRNASLGIALAEEALKRVDPAFVRGDTLPKEFVDGIEKVVWRGRCEVLQEGRMRWHVDGAHTVDSLRLAGQWFAGECKDRTGPRALIFNQQGRTEAVDFLEGLYNGSKSADGRSFDHVVFCTNVTYAEAGYKRDFVNHQYDPKAIEKLTQQHMFADKWSQLDPSAKVTVVPSIEGAINHVRELTKDLEGEEDTVQSLITGSLHLVGGALGILEGADAL